MHDHRLAATWRTADGLRQLRQLFDLVVLDREVARAIVGPGFAGSTAELVRRT